MMWSFSSKEYRALREGRSHTNSFLSFLHSLNYWDFIRDTAAAIAFFFDFARRKPHTRSGFDSAFGVGGPNSSSFSFKRVDVSEEMDSPGEK